MIATKSIEQSPGDRSQLIAMVSLQKYAKASERALSNGQSMQVALREGIEAFCDSKKIEQYEGSKKVSLDGEQCVAKCRLAPDLAERFANKCEVKGYTKTLAIRLIIDQILSS